ncbi:radical SAM protein [Leptospira ognonensis]|uniref:Radical SAM protein n=1 Tax=Leptospira ognonensis TaxID=2484945 RepID=A0A4R9JY56_9LEPT|nr:radical SAM protein [Leptospira ognonensis]TGL58157.1 radical SAM protein [Leptospira ognonensis]
MNLPIWAKPDPADKTTFDPRAIFQAGERNHHIANTAYPIAHELTWGPYRVKNEAVYAEVLSAFGGIDSLNLYTHIPFCETRCYFCEYTVVGQSELDQTKEYMTHLNLEVKMYRERLGPKKIVGFDIGGGTPSFVDASLISEHIEHTNQCFTLSDDCEISIETTPKIASSDFDKLKSYQRAGIKRISMGIQVTEPNLLKLLGRSENGIIHHKKALDNMRRAGFQKINLDLMYGFADQSMESWEHTLRHAISLAPDYITLYRMRYKLTRISDQAERVVLSHVKEQAKLAKVILTETGYLANPGKNTYSKIPFDTGTSTYLTKRVIEGKSYLGMGLGAQSFSDTTISYNSGSVGKNLAPYFQKLKGNQFPIQDFYKLPQRHMMAKMISVSFYFGEINLNAFQSKFGVPLEEVYTQEVRFLIDEGYMQYRTSENGLDLQSCKEPLYRSCLSLTEKGAAHFNGCISLFYASSVQDYLIQRNPLSNIDFEKHRKLASKVG